MPITFSSFDNPGCILKSFLYYLISAAESRFKEIQMRQKPSRLGRWLSVKRWPCKSEDYSSIPKTHRHRAKPQAGHIDMYVGSPNQASPWGLGAGQPCLWGGRNLILFLSGQYLRTDTQCFPLACTCMNPTGTTYKHAHYVH